MTLGELRRVLAAQAVRLTVTAEGKLRYEAPNGLTEAVVDAMRAHRAALLRQAQADRLPDGRLNAAVLQLQLGRCASCAHWRGPDEYGDGLCPLGRRAHGWADGNPDAPVITTPLHECAAHGGKGWKQSHVGS